MNPETRLKRAVRLVMAHPEAVCFSMTHVPLFSRRFWLAAALATTMVHPLAAQVRGLNGIYRAEGRNPDGYTYPIIYVVMADGTLHGTWKSGAALEKLVRR